MRAPHQASARLPVFGLRGGLRLAKWGPAGVSKHVNGMNITNEQTTLQVRPRATEFIHPFIGGQEQHAAASERILPLTLMMLIAKSRVYTCDVLHASTGAR